jgi:hypothetical protein
MQLEDNKYIIGGTQCPSLGAVRTKRENLSFLMHENRLRLMLADIDGRHYDLPVTCDMLNFFFALTNDVRENFGLLEANEWLTAIPADEDVILRIGLARAWSGPNQQWSPERCYVQLNGIITKDNYYSIFAGPPE